MFKKPKQNPREVIIVRAIPAYDFTFVEKWSNRIVGCLAAIFFILFLLLVCVIMFYEPTKFKPVVKDYQKRSSSAPVQSTEDLRGGDSPSQVDGDRFGGPDRPDVRVGRRPDVGEPRP